MKVLMFSWEYPPHMVGGLGQHVYDLSRFLVKKGIITHVITPMVKEYPLYQISKGVHIHRVGSPAKEEDHFKTWIFSFNSEAIRQAVKLNSQVGGFDVIHAHDWLVAYAGRSVSKIFGIPLVTTIHATEHGRNIGLHNRIQLEINEIEKNLALEAEKVICCSEYMEKEINTLFDVDNDRISIIPNGVDPTLFADLPENPRFNISPNDKVVFFIGRLVPEKGVWQLIDSFPLVIDKVPEAQLYIGGKGPQKLDLKELAKELGIAERVHFTGFIRKHDRNYVYNQAKVAVFPSFYEPFGIVALEAMATNTPVIVGNVGGLAEIVDDRVTGVKIDAGNKKDLANAIIEILTDDEFALYLRNNASKVVENVYSWEAIAQDTAKIYKGAIKSQNKKQLGVI